MYVHVEAKAQCNYYLHGNEVYKESKSFDPCDYEDDYELCYEAAVVFYEEQCDAVNTVCGRDTWTGEVTLTCRWDKGLNLWEEYS